MLDQFENAEVITFDDVLRVIKSYISSSKIIEKILEAFAFASEKHKDQKRKSGEPYINHCIYVAYYLASYQSGPDTIIAGLLHDTIEDCNVSFDEIKTKFGEEVASIVAAVTKIKQLPDVSIEETSASTHRKLILAMAKDIRAIIVKLCDRLHNMETLNFTSVEHQKKISNETLQVYAPLAHRLGMSDLKNRLENLCLYYLNREVYDEVNKLISNKLTKESSTIESMIGEIKYNLDNENFKYRIFGRRKHLYSVYKKMYIKKVPFEQIFDLQAIRIVCENKLDCYAILGIIHTIYKPIPGRFKDYIAMPKTNMYQSLHTTVINGNGDLFEIQIRTEEMDYVAERGIAAHWIYKENMGQTMTKAQELSEKQLSWLRDLIKLNEENSDTNDVDYMKQVQKDLFETSIYVLTPHGKIIDMPQGSTPVDFAYRVHTGVGNSCVGALVNKVMVPLNTELKSGDIIEIITKNSASPSEDWLNFVKTNTAKSQIKKYLAKKLADNKQSYDEIVYKKGYQLFEEVCNGKQLDKNEILPLLENQSLFNFFNVSSSKEIFILLGQKSISTQQIFNQIFSKNLDVEKQLDIFGRKKGAYKTDKSKANILIKGADGIKIETAICCYPIPGDEIVGFITRGSGIKVHRCDCKNLANEKSRLIEACWNQNLEDNNSTYPVKLEIHSYDRSNLVIDFMALIATLKIQIESITAKSHYENKTASLTCIVFVKNIDELTFVESRIKQINGIMDVIRKND